MHYGKFLRNGTWRDSASRKKQAGDVGSHVLKAFLSISSNLLTNNKYSGTTSFDPPRVFNFPGFAGLMINMVSQINKSSLLDWILSLAHARPGSVEAIGMAHLYPKEVFSLWSATQAISPLIFLGYRVYLLYYSSWDFPRKNTIFEVALCPWLFLLIPSLSSWFRVERMQPGAISDHLYTPQGTNDSIFKHSNLRGSISVARVT